MNYFKLSKFFLYLVPFTIAIVNPRTLFPFIVSKYVWFRTSVDLALIFFLLGLLFYQHQSAEISINQRLKILFKHPLVIAVTAFTFIFVLASLLAFDPQIAFWSNFERGEGGLQILHLWLFFILAILLFTEEKDWQKLFIFSLVTGLLTGLYGVAAGLKYIDAKFQIYHRPDGGVERRLTGEGGPFFHTFNSFVGPAFNEPGYRFHGSIGNPAYVATYTIFLIFYALYLLSRRYQQLSAKISINQRFKQNFPLYLLILIFLIIFWAAATRGSFIGLIAAIIAFVGYFVFVHKKWRKWLLLGVAILLLVIGSLVYFRDTPFVKSIPGSRLFDLTVTAQTFRDRTIIWGMALRGWQERPILGWGPENFLQVFDRYFDPKFFEPSRGFGAWFDRAHSIYLDYLVETGILGLLAYLSIFVVFYVLLIKNSKFKALNPKEIQNYLGSFESALLFSLPVAYLVQGLVLFDVLPIYINLFIFFTFATYKLKPSNK